MDYFLKWLSGGQEEEDDDVKIMKDPPRLST
jgi:hypothetical protein